MPRCLDSIINQSLLDIEIVLVNNGSTDNSEKIMYRYQENHPERVIKVIRQDDKGLAQGRQTGIDNATGEFLTFLDADDYYLSTTAFEELYEVAKKNDIDIVEFETIREGKVLCSKYEGIHKSKDVLDDYFIHGANQMLWLRIYKKSLFNKTVMPGFYTNNEDIYGYPCLLYSASSILYYHKPLHNYSSDNETSVMTKYKNDTSYADKYFNNSFKALRAIKHIKAYLGIEVINERYKESFPLFVCTSIINTVLNKTYNNITWRQIEKSIIENTDFDTYQEVNDYIKSHFKKKGLTYFLIKTIGLKYTYYIKKQL